MKHYLEAARSNMSLVFMAILAFIIIAWLMFYHLGTITPALSFAEAHIAVSTYGWHGLYRSPFYLPINFVRSVFYKLFAVHTDLIIRTPNIVFGFLTIASFGGLIWLWYGSRTATLGTILFMSSAWTLHVSRLASNDVIYLLIPVILLIDCLMLHRKNSSPIVLFGTIIIWGILLYIPGTIWFIALTIFLQRKDVVHGWQSLKSRWQQALLVFAGIVWLPLLVRYLLSLHHLELWLGWPQHFGTATQFLKRFIGVPVHLLVRGPEYSQLWLGRAPILDIFTVTMAIIGVYFYVIHLQTSRSRLLVSYSVLAWILVSIGGLVSLSILVTLMYIFTATGLLYFIREWFKVFPNNPIARNLGLTLIVIAVSLSAFYNLRSYFVAWPNSPATQQTFQTKIYKNK